MISRQKSPSHLSNGRNHAPANKGENDAKMMSPTKKKPFRRRIQNISPMILFLVCFLSSTLSFYAGIIVGVRMERSHEQDNAAPKGPQSMVTSNAESRRALTAAVVDEKILQSQRVAAAVTNGGESKETTKQKKESLPGNGSIGGKQTVPKDKQDNSNPSAPLQSNEKAKTKPNPVASSAQTKDDQTKQQPPNQPSPNLRSHTTTEKEAEAIHERKIEYLDKHRRQTRIFLPASEYVDRDEFLEKFESLGVPMDKTESKYNDRVMILYSDTSAYPDKETILNSNSSIFESDKEPEHPNIKAGVILSVDEATKNCNNLHVVLTNQDRPKQCLALVGQYESFVVHKFMRASVDPDPEFKNQNKFKMDSSFPLRHVNRGMKTDGGRSIRIPTEEHLQTNRRYLLDYLTSFESVLEKLRPVADRVSQHSSNHNTVIVMVCNFGQSELLMNFVCNARARGLEDELSSVLVFSTDEETHELATSLGLTSFYNEEIFGGMPKQAADVYGDDRFRKMMFAKVYCVHLISTLGHDLLFQDVDVVWYKNPLEWFHDDQNAAMQHYDMIFQDDGTRTLFYAPYSANTGFYYVRNNQQTMAFFNALLLSGDLILSTYSHQIALVSLLSEHASLYGLKVKIWDRAAEEFPGGQAFHEQPAAVKQMIQGDRSPYIFHMSWTENKKDKIRFMQQMGQWHVKDTCRNQPAATIAATMVGEATPTAADFRNECCLVEPQIQCHYRDKPSIVPCPDAPLIDEGGKSFW